MIRVAFFFICVGLLALGAAWFVDRPGDVAITWLGYRIETSVTVAAVALLSLVAAAILIWSLLRFVWRSPEQVSLFIRNRRAMRGYHAISRGLIAIGSGDAQAARRAAGDAQRLSPHEPLTLLLSAQAAQLSGAANEAETAFRAMAERRDTRLLGLRGLYVEAQRRDDRQAARRHAEAAAKDAPGVNWATQAVLDFRCADGDWAGALERLELMRRDLDKPAYRRQQAVLLTARALSEHDRDAALTLAREAVKLAPSLVPAAVFVGRRLAEAGERRKASRLLDIAWRANPHPDLADAYAGARLGAAARERLARVRSLSEKTPGSIEGSLALARAAIDARQFDEARTTLAPYLTTPTRRVALLMAAIEDGEHGDAGRAREWMARAVQAAPDPVWTADGVVSETWLPVSPVTGRLDAFEWKVPVHEIGVERPVIDVAAEASPPAIARAIADAATPPSPEAADAEPEDAAEDRLAAVPPAPVEADAKVAPVSPGPSPPGPAAAAARPATPVIPLVQAPDDPGLGGTGVDDRSDREGTPAFSAPPDSWATPKTATETGGNWFQRLFR
ncbi:MAG TPA: heme biosynthesis HemY N-terminal domain-containing protein [Pseudolabrys sp.]|nr:heme biosynthesis HemY N-terminal domain-containing protein [Pseudolabrys sp.]